jgi:quinol monooxygenase YgiN
MPDSLSPPAGAVSGGAASETDTVYVSITGLRLKAPWHLPRFMWHAVRAMTQAQKAPGNLSVAARRIDGVHHTLTVWTDAAAMRRFVASGAHLQAMRAFPVIATGKTLGFETRRDKVPGWDQIPTLFDELGREYQAPQRAR